MYIVAKEQYLTTLLKEGTISQDEFDKMDRFLYERFHIKGTSMDTLSASRASIIAAARAKPKIEKKNPPEAPTKEESPEPMVSKSTKFISLTETARSCTEGSPAYVIQSWIRSSNTLNFLGLWN